MDSPLTHVDRLCASTTFRGSPKVAALLKFLASDACADGDPPTARLIAARVLEADDPGSPASGAAVRMQVGRLRKLLRQYYSGEGAADPIRIELPLRDYRLQFLREGQPVVAADAPQAVPPPPSDVPVLVVATPRLLVPEPSPTELAGAFATNLVAELGGHSLVAMIGPVASPQAKRAVSAPIDPRFERSATFVLDTALQAAGDQVRVLAVLTSGPAARQVWSKAYEFAAAPDASGRSMAGAARRLAADVADECGAMFREILRVSAGTPIDRLSVVEAGATLWRYLVTGSQDDLAFSRRALDHAVANSPDSPLVLLFWTAATCQDYTSSLDPRGRLPELVSERIEAARRAALGHPWVEIVRAYVLWLIRHPAGVAAILDQLETVPGSPTFRGMLGAMRVAADLDPDRGREILAAAIADGPQPLLWFHLCAALHDLRRGDLGAAERALARIDAPTRPEPVVLRAAVAAARGDLDSARRILATVTDALPEFPVVGEVILRRWLHDDHVDALATLFRPLGIDWFHAPRIGIVRG